MSDITTLMMAAAGAGGEETDENFNQTVLLLHGDGTNGAQNNTFLDSSTNNFTITRNGNTTQGTFSPFSAPDGRWSNYFDGANDWFNLTNNADFDFGSGDLTIECWFYLTGNAAANPAGTRSAQLFNAFPNSGTRVDDYDFRVDGDGSTTGTGLTFRTTISGSSQSTTYTATITKNTWHHFAAVKSGNTVSLFYDGVRVQQNASVTNQVNSGGNPIKIGALRFTDGASQLYDNSFPGYISNLRVLNGTALYSGATYTVPTGPLTAIANTVLLTCQSNRFVDNSTNNFAITRNGNVKVTPFSPFAPTAAYDASVNGGSGYFDGTADYLQVSDATLALGTGDFSIQFWVYNIAFDGNAGINTHIDYRNGSDPVISPVIFTTNGQLFFRTNGSNVISGSTLNLNEWYFIGISRASGTTKMFVNGVQVGSDYSDTNNYTSSVIRIGADYDSTLNNELNGYMSGLKITQGAAVDFSALGVPTTPPTADANTELLLNFTNAGIFDNTGKNNLETVGNAQIDTTVKKYGTGAIEYDGSGDYLKILPKPELILAGDFTIDCWFNFTGTSGSYESILDTRDASASTTGFFLGLDTALKPVFFTAGANRILAGSAISTSTWYFLRLTRASGDIKLFIDGTQVGSTYSNSNVFTNPKFNLGADQTGTTNFWTGFVDDFRITNGVARSGAEVPTKAFPDL